MGYVIRNKQRSLELVSTHRLAMRIFSLITVAYHLFFLAFVCWLLLPEGVGDLTAADSKLAAFAPDLLADFQLQIDVELAARCDLSLHIFAVDNVVHRWSHAWPEKAVAHLLAHHDVIAATF